MDSQDANWFHKNYSILEFSYQTDIRTFNDGPQRFQIQGDNDTVIMKMPKVAFERLVLESKIGLEELRRARDRADKPNVQEAYDAYIMLHALSKNYDK